MSYSFSTTHKSPDDAKEQAADHLAAQKVPDGIMATLNDMLDTYRDNGVTLVDVALYGHCPTPGEKSPGCAGTAHITVTVLNSE